jgi:hypothetical protein
MRVALSHVGPSVILTSVSLFLGFLVASVVRIPAVYTFAWQLAATILINLILMFLVFMPLCALDCRRVARRRADIFPCIPTRCERDEASCGRGTVGAAVARFAGDVLGPKLLFRSRRTAGGVIIATVLFTGGMAGLGVVKSQPGLPLNTVALRSTYQRDFLDVQEASFPVFASFLVSFASAGAPEGALARSGVQQAIIAQSDALQRAEGTSATPAIHEVSWFHNSSGSFLGGHNARANVANRNAAIATEGEFREAFGTFAATSSGPYLGDMYCEWRAGFGDGVTPCDLRGGYPGEIAQRVELRGSRMPFLQSGLSDTSTVVSAIRASRAAVDGAGGAAASAGDVWDSFVYGLVFEYYEQYVSIYRDLLKVVGYAFLGVTVVTFALLRSVRLTAGIVAVMVAILLQGFGLCTAMGIRVNAVSVTSYVITIALSVEFTAHYAHAYSECGGGDRRSRAQEALTRVLPPGVNGFASTALSLLALFGSRFPFVRLYYGASWMLLSGVAFLNGAVLLPCLLWLAGPSDGGGGRCRRAARPDASRPQR